jgi:alcohol dehydrogenase
MPGVIEIVADIMPKKVQRVGELMGLVLPDGISPVELGKLVSACITAFSKSLGIPTLKELKIKETDFVPLAHGTMGDGCFFFIPKKLTLNDVLDIIGKAYAI